MEREELEQFIKSYIKDNLRLYVNTLEEYDYGCVNQIVEVDVYLGDEKISSESDYFTVKED